MTRYTFGDDPTATERLVVLDRVFGAAADSLLAGLDIAPRAVADLGCGPGPTTARLAARYPSARVVGIDASADFVDRAAARVPEASFLVGDVTRALPGAPYDAVYARFLLAHLPDVAGALRTWGDALAPGGLLVLEETESIATDVPDFARYLRLTVDRVAAQGATMCAGPLIVGALPPDLAVEHDAVVGLDLSLGEAASMFWRNLASWGDEAVADGLLTDAERAALLAGLRSHADDPARGHLDWRHRQVVARLG